MSETASGLMRVVVLMLATTTFAAVWNSDQQTQYDFILARKAAAQQDERALLAEQPDQTPQQEMSAASQLLVSTEATAAPRQHRLPPGTPVVARVEIDFSLPAGIAPGRYHVVDQSGRQQQIYVPQVSDSFAEQDIYVLTLQDGRRRYFIRITDPAGEDASAPTAAVTSKIWH